MKIVVITGSPRINGNTEIMADEFIRGAQAAGSDIVKFNAAKLKISPCIACMYCFEHSGKCAFKDDMVKVIREIDQADLIVFASPLYWFGMSAQIKLVIDRFFCRDNGNFNPRFAILLMNAEQSNTSAFGGAVASFGLLCDYLKLQNRGVITIGGMAKKGDMVHSGELEKIYDLGHNLI